VLKEAERRFKGPALKTPKQTAASRKEALCQRGKQQQNGKAVWPKAHAGCFTMALTAQLSRAGIAPMRIHTGAKGETGKGWQSYIRRCFF
jgi:organic hydroperoxide reductase OsmC/OhrA